MKIRRITGSFSRAFAPSRVGSSPGRGRIARSLVVLGLVGSLSGTRAAWASAHEDTHTHASLTAGALTLLDDDFYTAARRALLVQASVDEDQCPNYLSHFYNPKTGADGGIYISTCDLFPTVTTALGRATAFYNGAVVNYRQGDTDSAFRQLGAVMHLLQDMTSPAHVHGDPHAQVLFGECANDGDDFEKWGWCESKNTDHIRDYVSSSGAITPRLQRSLDLLYAGQAQFPPSGLHASAFVDHVAELVYDFTAYRVRLLDDTFFDDPQPNSELKRMFPTLREGTPGFYIDGAGDMTIGYANGTCGGCTQDEWWLMSTSCAGNGNCTFAATDANGFAYIENTGGEAGSRGGTFLEDKLVPRVFEKGLFVDLYGTTQNAGIPSGFGDPRAVKTMLRIYGDVLYATAVAYGAGLLQAFHDEVAPRPMADAGGPYQGDGCSPIAFDGSGSSDANGTIARYDWDFDADGVVDATSTNPLIEHRFSGAYVGQVLLTVTDDEGRTDQDAGDIDVAQCASPTSSSSSSGGGCIGSVGQPPHSGLDSSLLLVAIVLMVLVVRSKAAGRALEARIRP